MADSKAQTKFRRSLENLVVGRSRMTKTWQNHRNLSEGVPKDQPKDNQSIKIDDNNGFIIIMKKPNP